VTIKSLQRSKRYVNQSKRDFPASDVIDPTAKGEAVLRSGWIRCGQAGRYI